MTMSLNSTHCIGTLRLHIRGEEQENIMGLARNVGSIDKVIRLIAGVALAAFAFLGAGLSTTIGLVALIVGVVLIATGLINFCPLFKILGISSFRTS